MLRYVSFVIAILLLVTSFRVSKATERVLPFCIEIIDASTGWAVPLVELRTTSSIRFISDNAGVIAIDSPELLNQEIWFDVISDGYEVAADGFGFRGVRLTPEPGKTTQLKLKRTILAKRIGRLTGSGLFAESQKLGRELDHEESGIVGCDSIHVTRWQNSYFWLWGDTTLRNYPLGIFNTLGATTQSKSFLSGKPPLHPKFKYLERKNKPYGIAPIEGEGPTWLMGLAVVRDGSNQDRLVASYSKVRNHLEVYEWGLCIWDEQKSMFIRHKKIWSKSSDSSTPPPLPNGHAVRVKDSDGNSRLLFGDPFPFLACDATLEAWEDPDRWERIEPAKFATALSPSAKQVVPHRGEIGFHTQSKNWITIFTELNGSPSAFGEIWVAHSNSPTGPWLDAVKVLSHRNYSFYNPIMHLDVESDSPTLLFEGTYTAEFANKPEISARYNYNQILYRLDLNDLPWNESRKN